MDVEESNLEGKQPSHEKLTWLEKEQPSYKEVTRLKSEPKGIKQNKKGGIKLQKSYEKRSCTTLLKKKKSAREQKMEAFNIETQGPMAMAY